MKHNSSLLAVLFMWISGSAFATDFGPADALYAERENGDEAISEARDAYIALMPSATQDELVYAAEQVARLSVYQALKISEDQISSRLPILDSCLKDIEEIGPGRGIKLTPEYLYWKVTCKALWCEAKGIMSSLSQAKQLVKDIEDGVKLDPTYEGGGFDRAAGVIYMKLPKINPFGPRGDLNKSLRHFDASLKSNAYSRARNPATETGNYHFPTHYYYAQALIKIGKKAEAVRILDDSIQRIESGDLPLGREPETRLVFELIKDLRATLP